MSSSLLQLVKARWKVGSNLLYLGVYEAVVSARSQFAILEIG
jgi:hypothetical protein